MIGGRVWVAVVVVGCLGVACASTANASPPWCEAIGEVDAAIDRTGEQTPEERRDTFASLDHARAILAEKAPDDARADAQRVADALAQAAGTGDLDLSSPGLDQAMAGVHVIAAEDCKYERVSIVATDFVFNGTPLTINAGRIALSFENHSDTEPHELVLVRKMDGIVARMAEILSLPEAEARTKVQSVAFTTAEAGQRNGLILDLEPGDYALVCFLPIGEDGPPHFTAGMAADFTVR